MKEEIQIIINDLKDGNINNDSIELLSNYITDLEQKVEKFENNGFMRYINSKKRKVYQYDLKGNFIQEWESARAVQRGLHLSNASVLECCKGIRHRRTLGGYIWKFERVDE